MKKKKNGTVVAARKAELETIGDVQARIDRVAHDFSTRKNRYAVLDAGTLGELLGVDAEDV